MDRDEILAKSREENKNKDLVEREALALAYRAALGVGMLICAVLAVLHVIFMETVDHGVWTVYFSVVAATMLTKYVQLRRRHELLLGLLYAGFCVMFFVLYLKDLGVF